MSMNGALPEENRIRTRYSFRVSLDHIVYCLFFITILFLLLNTTDNFPFSFQLQWFKYIYIVVMLGVNIVVVRAKRIHIPVVIYLGLLFLHTFLFCCVFTNDTIIESTQEHLKNLLIFYVVVILTARYCHWSGTRFQLTVTSFLAFMLFLLWSYFTHFSGFLPLRYLFRIPGIIKGSVTYGVTYGTSSYNVIANTINCALVLLCSIFLYRDQLKGVLKKYQEIIYFLCTVFLCLILISTTGRAEMIVAALFGMIVLWLFWLKDRFHLANNGVATFILRVVIIVCVAVLVAWYINFTLSEGSISNRSKNLTVNLEAFKAYGNTLFGMGYADHYAFLKKIYGYTTYACDVYFLYIYFSSGVVGILLIGSSLVYLAYQIFFGKVEDKKFKYIMIALFIMNIVNSMYHVCINSYYYISCYIYTTLYIVYLYEVKPNGVRLRL